MQDSTDLAQENRTAVDKAVAVLKAFGADRHTGVGVSELGRRAGLSKSTTFRLLAMLQRNGMVDRTGTVYRLGRALEEIGGPAALPAHNSVRDLLTPFLAELFAETHATVQLAMLDGSDVVYLNKLEGANGLRTPSRIGGRMPAYCTAVGKVLLASDASAAEAVLRGPRHAWTRNTLVDEDDLMAELAHVRRTGLAHDRGESMENLYCIAVPVRGHGGRVIASFSVSGDASFRPLRHERVLRSVAFSASRIAASRIRLAA
ncbi:IclR family transcriptional regulator [Microbacterium testaceum]|uniref:IclR family transcriptional regulator n=1 Tax=Microbacterium testaceum TaxID=2033 RepID=A0A2T7WV91_MICTE|nr:IclR family transcriptional regulator [Microbacterium testaceum]PVE77842.1 IclR family transcriptional regulator [Microbacterium testaceum]